MASRRPKAKLENCKSQGRPAPDTIGTIGKKAAILFLAPGHAAATNTPKARTDTLFIRGETTTCSKSAAFGFHPLKSNPHWLRTPPCSKPQWWRKLMKTV